MIELVLCFATAFSLTYFAIPPIISIALAKNLCDEPDERRTHQVPTPSLGGIAIFGGIIFSMVLWTPPSFFINLQYVLCSFILIFLIGAKDDLAPVAANKKMIAQILAASILVMKSDVQLHSLYGLAGFYGSLPNWLGIALSIFTILVIMNAINLIDGIDGLAGSLSAVIFSVFGVWFYLAGHYEFSILALASLGAVLAFLKYNFSPSKIFMGDTGSLILGITVAILALKFIDYNYLLAKDSIYRFQAGPAIAIGILVVPLFDTLRVFTTRILRGGSPFKPDRRHIHHLLIDAGCTHLQATGVLVMTNLLLISLVFLLDSFLNASYIVLILLAVVLGLTYFLHRSVYHRHKEQAKLAIK